VCPGTIRAQTEIKEYIRKLSTQLGRQPAGCKLSSYQDKSHSAALHEGVCLVHEAGLVREALDTVDHDLSATSSIAMSKRLNMLQHQGRKRSRDSESLESVESETRDS